MTSMKRLPLVLSMLATSIVLGGCVERRVWIETDPPGALVWLNDTQVGRSPVGVSITHHGIYDVRIEKEGFEPLLTSADSEGPLWDTVPLDFFAEILPIDAKCEKGWKFTLSPRDDSEVALVGRATDLRDRLRVESEQKPLDGKSAGEEEIEKLEEAVEAKPQDPGLRSSSGLQSQGLAPKPVPMQAPPAPTVPPSQVP
ncbi:MAG: PEGA domain-containing protein [bacterium]